MLSQGPMHRIHSRHYMQCTGKSLLRGAPKMTDNNSQISMRRLWLICMNATL